jgi:hypothetical protein
MTALSSRILKGGALLGDSRRLSEVWNRDLPVADNLRIVDEGNLLGKSSRARARDVLIVLRARFIDPGPHVMPALQTLMAHPAAFRDACYYETARVDGLLAAFAEGQLHEWFAAGRPLVSVQETAGWIAGLVKAQRLPAWSDQVRGRAARGLLSTLRDFGVLEGAVRKRFAVPGMSRVGFAYVAYREQEQDRSSRALVASPIWRRWLLDPPRVTELFAQAESLGVLRYSQVGSAVRIDWRVKTLEEVARAAA